MCLISAFPFQAINAEETSYNASYVKAAYIKKLLAFVEWPHSVNNYQICVLGDDLVGTSLGAIASTDKQDDLILKIEKVKLTDDFSHCKALFIGDSQEKLLALALSKAGEFSILTISDVEGSLEKGSIIEFFTIDDSVKIGVNKKAAKNASLKLSTPLLEVAYKVIDHVSTP